MVYCSSHLIRADSAALPASAAPEPPPQKYRREQPLASHVVETLVAFQRGPPVTRRVLQAGLNFRLLKRHGGNSEGATHHSRKHSPCFFAIVSYEQDKRHSSAQVETTHRQIPHCLRLSLKYSRRRVTTLARNYSGRRPSLEAASPGAKEACPEHSAHNLGEIQDHIPDPRAMAYRIPCWSATVFGELTEMSIGTLSLAVSLRFATLPRKPGLKSRECRMKERGKATSAEYMGVSRGKREKGSKPVD